MAVKNLEIVQVAIEQLDKRESEMIKAMLVQFMKENLKVPKAKKINMFDYVAIDDEAKKRPNLSGVFMDKERKAAVAIDGHTAIISKSDYKPTKFENGIIGKNGENISGKYPNYWLAMPKPDDRVELTPLTEEAIIETALAMKAKNELNGCDIPIGVFISSNKVNGYFPAKRLPLLLEIGLDGWVFCPKKLCYYYKDDDKEIVVMSILINE